MFRKNKIKKLKNNIATIDISTLIEEKLSLLNKSSSIGDLKASLEEEKIKKEQLKNMREAIDIAYTEADIRRKEELAQKQHELEIASLEYKKKNIGKNQGIKKDNSLKNWILLIIFVFIIIIISFNNSDGKIISTTNKYLNTQLEF